MLYEGKVTVMNVLLFFIERTIQIAYPMDMLADVNFEEAIKIAQYFL
jgi:hypothetical protein